MIKTVENQNQKGERRNKNSFSILFGLGGKYIIFHSEGKGVKNICVLKTNVVN
nr:MAG TPA: hypothetical protein [Caudoviricetes sp.]